MAQSTRQVPWPYIDGLPPTTREQIRRNFEYVTAAFDTIPSVGYDATVLPGVTANDSTRTYPTVFSAIAALDTAGFTSARIGIIARNTGTITEVGNLNATTNLKAVTVASVDGGRGDGTFLAGARWDINSRTMSTSGIRAWNLFGLRIATTKTTQFFEGTVALYASQCRFQADGATSTLCPTIVSSSYVDCRLVGCALNEVDPSRAYCFSCDLFWNTVATLSCADWWSQYGCYYEWSGNTAINQAVTGATQGTQKQMHMIGATFGQVGQGVGGISTDILTITCNGQRQSVCITGGGHVGGLSTVSLAISNYGDCYVDLQGVDITLGAPGTTTTACAHIGGSFTGTANITGPAHFAGVCQALILQGNGVGGSAEVVYSAASGTAVTGTAVTDSAMVITARRHPGTASSSQKLHAFDASCARNVFVIEGFNNFPTASTNSSATTLVIDHNGAPPSGAAGGDLSGTYPNPSVVDDSHNHTSTTLLAPIVYDGDAAGGDLTGTYPNPTLATSGVSSGTYGSLPEKTTFVVDAKGRLTSATDITTGYTALIGDGASTSINVDHNLGTKSILWTLHDESSGADILPNTATRSTTNRLVLTFSVAPTSNQYRVTVEAVI